MGKGVQSTVLQEMIVYITKRTIVVSTSTPHSLSPNSLSGFRP